MTESPERNEQRLQRIVAAAGITFHRMKMPFPLRFASLFTLIAGGVTLLSSWHSVDLIGQAGRFHLVMEMAIVLLVAFALPRQIRWTNPWRLGIAVVILLASAALLASYVPAHRAASINPIEALRAE